MCNILERFEDTESDVVRPVCHRFTRSTLNIATVIESVAEDPNMSEFRLYQKLGLSYGTL